MSPVARRVFIAIDEWLWIWTSMYIARSAPEFFWAFFAAGFVAVYCISYPLHWRLEFLGR